MKKELKDYINLYIGCECIDDNGSIYKLKPSHLPSNWQEAPCTHKFILRKLEDMTDEEAEQFEVLEMIHNISKEEISDEILSRGAPETFVYALKQRFDLFGLIESGLAIDKTTIK